jgi:hypothetical protein
MTLESNKKELLLEVNSFNKPAELLGKTAWTQLIKNLLFLEPGTYPSVPDMGINIQSVQFEFMDDILDTIADKIKNQVNTYLPDIPLTGVNAQSTEYEGQKILLIILTFVDNGALETTAIASVVADRIIDFEISE